LGKGALLNGASAYRGLFAYSGTTTITNDEVGGGSSADILRQYDSQFPVSISDAHNGVFALESWLAPVSSAETGDATTLTKAPAPHATPGALASLERLDRSRAWPRLVMRAALL
jgi:hypothetical protein